MRDDEYVSYDAIGLAELIARRDVTATEVLEAAIARIAARNPRLNAVVLPMFDYARDAITAGLPNARLTGVPFLLKDLGQMVAGIVTSNGSRLYAGNRGDHDSTLVTRYKAAGLVVCGKTNTPELGLATTTEPVLHGPTRNPWQPDFSAGGSSGGAGAAVAAGFVPIAHASDGGGSIRIPASCCGLFGLKPTRGRVPLGPDALEGWGGLSTVHAVSRTVRDSALLLELTAGEELGAPYFAPPKEAYSTLIERPPAPLRIGLCLEPFTGATLDPEVRTIVERAAAFCESLGHRVEHAAPKIDRDEFKSAHGVIAISHCAATIDARLRALGRDLAEADIEAVTRSNYDAAKAIPAIEFARSMDTIRRLGRQVAEFFTAYDLLLTPTMACPPPKLGALDMNGRDTSRYLTLLYAMIAFTALFNDTGNPAMSVPLGRSANGLPVGVQFVGAFGDESLLLRTARQLEAAGAFLPTLAPSVA